jgi:glutamate-1-semialdehyde 2,1-aminomutase
MNFVANGSVMHAGTYNSNNPSIAAAAATVNVLASTPGLYERLRDLGMRLQDGLQAAACDAGHSVLISGPGAMTHLAFTRLEKLGNYRDCLECDTAKYTTFARGMLDRGVRLIGRGIWYISTAHTEQDIDYAVEVAREVFFAMNQNGNATVRALANEGNGVFEPHVAEQQI